jgi:glycerol uptake facilitator-like aquaporin
MYTLASRALAEFVGTLFLVTTIVGSGIAAESLTGDHGLRLAINAAATALGLLVVLTVLGPISGAHLHPLVSIADAALGQRSWLDALAYVPAQVAGALLGAVLANTMFDLPAVSISQTIRATPAHLFSEIVASAGLLLVIMVLARTNRPRLSPGIVAAYIGAAYFATSSTSFANPAVTISRVFSNTFAGIAPGSAALFLVAQVIGAALGVGGSLLMTVGLEALIGCTSRTPGVRRRPRR